MTWIKLSPPLFSCMAKLLWHLAQIWFLSWNIFWLFKEEMVSPIFYWSDSAVIHIIPLSSYLLVGSFLQGERALREPTHAAHFDNCSNETVSGTQLIPNQSFLSVKNGSAHAESTRWLSRDAKREWLYWYEAGLGDFQECQKNSKISLLQRIYVHKHRHTQRNSQKDTGLQ